MNDFTVISYSSSNTNNLLSLTESRSRYMLPFGGRYRVVDFTIRNSISSGARKTIIYNNCEDELESYVEHYGPFKNMKFPLIKVVSREYSDMRFCYNLILDSNTAYYIIYNGDNPSVIDFTQLFKVYKKMRSSAVLFKLKISGKATMAHTVLVINQKGLMKIINSAIEEDSRSPNIFEMIINILTNKGIKSDIIDAYYWPVKNIPEYYYINMDILRDPTLLKLLCSESLMRGFINNDRAAKVGIKANILNSFISDNCQIFGTVINSIIFPGVEIGEMSIVKDSIVLPFTRIGAGVRIIKSLIDERTDFNTEKDHLNIGDGCIIGTRDNQIKNNDFPRSVFGSITLIGKDCTIPEGAKIGGACYIASGKGEKFFSKTRHLYNGLSIA
ncbi:MAG: hypothetical protein SVZ03_01355 [Spirochaetota bacterium]|nr:hypothetical protein [Spirochaetota bacterium]